MPNGTPLNLTSTLILLALAAVWGGSFFFAEVALTEVPPMTVTLHRVVWALPMLLRNRPVNTLWLGPVYL